MYIALFSRSTPKHAFRSLLTRMYHQGSSPAVRASVPNVRTARSKSSSSPTANASTQSEGLSSYLLDDPSIHGKIVTVTSGKGGVGKTTTAASFAYGLAAAGKKVCAIDFDIGLRNLDLHLGMERRVVFDFVHVILGDCTLHQALIKDRHQPNLHLLAASQTRDKTILTRDGVAKVLSELRKDFDYVVCDSPAGIESGAFMAMYFADEAVVCTNPELSSVRDSDKMLGIIASQSLRAERAVSPVKTHLLVTRYVPEKVLRESMLSVTDIQEMLGIPLLGVVPDSDDVLQATNVGKPTIANKVESRAAQAYQDMVDRYLGHDRPMRFITPESKGLFGKLFG